jgi:hypothetical protein
MKKLSLFLVIASIHFTVSAQKIFIQCGKLVDVKTAKLLTSKTIVYSMNRLNMKNLLSYTRQAKLRNLIWWFKLMSS